jgi:hypothetical protein
VLFDKEKYPKLDVNLKMQMAIDICSGMAWMSGQNVCETISVTIN